MTGSQEDLLASQDDVQSHHSAMLIPEETPLTPVEKKFLLFAERGDCATVRRLLDEYRGQPDVLNINCVDPLNRSALVASIENENPELIHILLDYNIKVEDALLHAIKEQYVEAVEILLEHEEKVHKPGMPYSWEAVDREKSTFTQDITPLILAAHMNNYEIIKLLLDRGASLPLPHDVRCGCDDCVISTQDDSLRHSQSRINAYKALTSPSLIALSSADPLRTAFELSWELRRLAIMETEFRAEYNRLRKQCQEFATSMLDHARTSYELEIMLNYDPQGDVWEPGERQSLERLKKAIKYKQKEFVAHPNVQQLLAAIWYDGLPGFRRKSMLLQLMGVAKMGTMFPIYSLMYMISPKSIPGQLMQKPFVKFICHSASYFFFLLLLSAASQRVEYVLIEWFGNQWMQELLADWLRRERGCVPGPTECFICLYIFSIVWGEIRSLWNEGFVEYTSDLWNIVDFITNIFYITWIALRVTSWYIVRREYWNGGNPWYPREMWHPFDPMLLSEGMFAAAMIFSYMKLVHIFSVNPHLGPLQISLGRMVIDIIKFFFIYSLVLFAFGCGMNQLMWYYSDLERRECYHHGRKEADWETAEMACNIWRRFSNLFETSQSLFWASFGLVDLQVFELNGIKSFTRFWALLMFGSYSVINVIVLLNMLIAMMSNSYQIISERSDTEWKFARSRLWMSYFEESDVVPPPLNLIPTPTMFKEICGSEADTKESLKRRSHEKAAVRHIGVMRLLVRRYVTAEQRKSDDFSITEDDVNEIRQDISSFRYELIDILRNNGMTTPHVNKSDVTKVAGKKGRVMERRLLKDFQIGFIEGIVRDALTTERKPNDVFSKIARAIGKRGTKKDWNAEVRRRSTKRDPIGQSDLNLRRSQHSIRKYILAHKDSMDPQKLLEYNPRLSEVTPTTRVAYAKFKMNKIRKELDEMEKIDEGQNTSQEMKDVERTIDRIAYERWSRNVMKNRERQHTVVNIDTNEATSRNSHTAPTNVDGSLKSRTLPPRKFVSMKKKDLETQDNAEAKAKANSTTKASGSENQVNVKTHQEPHVRIVNPRASPQQPSKPPALPTQPPKGPPPMIKPSRSPIPPEPPKAPPPMPKPSQSPLPSGPPKGPPPMPKPSQSPLPSGSSRGPSPMSKPSHSPTPSEPPSGGPPPIPKSLKSKGSSPIPPPSPKPSTSVTKSASPSIRVTAPTPSPSSTHEDNQYVPSGKSKVTGQVRTGWI